MAFCMQSHSFKKEKRHLKSTTLQVRVTPSTLAMIEQLQTIIIRGMDENAKPRSTIRTKSEILRQAITALFNSPRKKKWRKEMQDEVDGAKRNGMMIPSPKHIDGRTRNRLLLTDGAGK